MEVSEFEYRTHPMRSSMVEQARLWAPTSDMFEGWGVGVGQGHDRPVHPGSGVDRRKIDIPVADSTDTVAAEAQEASIETPGGETIGTLSSVSLGQ